MRQNFYIQWTDPFFFHYHLISPKVWDSTEKEKANLPIYNHLFSFSLSSIHIAICIIYLNYFPCLGTHQFDGINIYGLWPSPKSAKINNCNASCGCTCVVCAVLLYAYTGTPQGVCLQMLCHAGCGVKLCMCLSSPQCLLQNVKIIAMM